MTIVLHWPESWTVLGWDLCYGVLRSGDPSVNGSTLRLAFPGCPSPAEPFLRIRLDCTQPGKFWVGDGRVRYCGGYAEQEHYGLWVDIGDFCGANHHEGCNPCGYRGLSGTFSPSALQVVLAPGSTYVDTLLVSGSLGPDCGGLPECGGPWYGACFGGLYADQPWMTVTLLDLPEEGYHTMRYRLVVTQPGPSPGEYNGRVYASNGCHCTPNCMPVTVLVGAPGDAPPAEEPSADLLGLPSPNPTAGAVRFAIHLPARMEARVSVFDAGGRLVARVLDGEQPAGTSYHAWAPSDPLLRSIPSGIYFLRVETGGEARSRMIVLGR